MTIRYADDLAIYTNNGEVHAQGRNVVSRDAQAMQCMEADGLHVLLQGDTTPVRYLRLRWKFTAQDDADLTNMKILGDAWERGYGDLAWRGMTPERCMPWVFAASNGSDQQRDQSGRKTLCFGVKTGAGAFCMWQCDPKGVTLLVDVRCGSEGVLLSGRTLSACTVCMETYTDCRAFEALQRFYHQLSPNPLLPAQPVYGSNNWYYAYGQSSHEEIISDSRFVAAQCKGLENRPFMVIDDGWQPNSCDGPWYQGNERFPDMKGLCEAMRAEGVRPGIWIRYLSDRSGAEKSMSPETRLSRDPQFLDPSHPEVLAKVAEDTRRIVEDWGFELIKHDFSTFDMFGKWGAQCPGFMAGGCWHFYDQSKTSAEIVRTFYQTIREAAGEQCLLLGCNVIGHLAAGLVHMNRTGDDTSGREWERTRRMGVNTLAFRMAQHKALFDVDADCVGIMGMIDWSLNRQWLRALSESGTPLFVSCKPDIADENVLHDLRKAFAKGARQEKIMIPVDWMETTCPAHWERGGEIVTFDWYPEDGLPCDWIR